jgi:ferric-dicitrate binding protein FerR (iron transport regulator)
MKLFLFLFLFSFSSLANFAVISKIKGKVVVNVSTLASVGTPLKEFDIVEAIGKKSYVEIKFESGHLVRIRNGKSVLKKMNKDQTVFKLIKGKIYSFVKGLSSKQKFKVETSHSSLGVRGTMFMVEANQDKTYLCVCEGSVEAASAQKKNLVKRGEDQFFDGLAKSSPTKANSMMMKMATEEFRDMGLEL